MTARLLGRDDRVPQPQNGSRMTFPRFDTSRIATGLTVGGIASSSMRSRLRLAFAPAVFGALRDLTNNYAAALALAGALQCAAAALVLAAKPRRSRRRLRAPRKADDVDPFFSLSLSRQTRWRASLARRGPIQSQPSECPDADGGRRCIRTTNLECPDADGGRRCIRTTNLEMILGARRRGRRHASATPRCSPRALSRRSHRGWGKTIP